MNIPPSRIVSGIDQSCYLPAMERVFNLGRPVIVAWLVAWISLIPLIHVHLTQVPDERDLGASHFTEIPHTVFSKDVPNEFRAPAHRPPVRATVVTSLTTVDKGELYLSTLGGSDHRKPVKSSHSPLTSTDCPYCAPFDSSSPCRVPGHFAGVVTVSDAARFRAPPVGVA